MTVNVNTQKALGGNNPISLKGTANNGIAGWFEGPTSAVKFSDYYRKTSTDLTKANFSGADLSNAKFTNCILEKSRLLNATLVGTTFDKETLVRLKGVKICENGLHYLLETLQWEVV